MNKQGKINQIVADIIEEGTMNTSSLNWCFYWEEFEENEEFVKENCEEIYEELATRDEVLDVELEEECISVVFGGAYCPNADDFFASVYYAKEIANCKDKAKLEKIIELLIDKINEVVEDVEELNDIQNEVIELLGSEEQ